MLPISAWPNRASIPASSCSAIPRWFPARLPIFSIREASPGNSPPASSGNSSPVFTSGGNRVLLDAANSRQREALLGYEKSVLGAIGEADSQLASLEANHRRFASLSGAVDANAESARLAKELSHEGRSNLLALLVEEQRLNILTLDRIRSQTSLILSWIRVHQALGGGWQPTKA